MWQSGRPHAAEQVGGGARGGGPSLLEAAAQGLVLEAAAQGLVLEAAAQGLVLEAPGQGLVLEAAAGARWRRLERRHLAPGPCLS
jgi:hypothetical protein